MTRYLIVSAIAILAASLPSFAHDKSSKIAIIKADDVRCITDKWNRFFDLNREKGVKVSAGIVCESLPGDSPDYFDWLKTLMASGSVEFWNHGWNHSKWTTPDQKKISEFCGSGYELQKKHFEDAQKLMKKVLGVATVAFGTPFNTVDADTVKVMKEDPDMRLFFCYSVDGLDDKVLAPMTIRGENDGTGRPNLEKFKTEYEKQKDVSFSAIQFHPNAFSDESFTEYAKIIDFLRAEGWTFMLPAEYVAMLDQAKKQ